MIASHRLSTKTGQFHILAWARSEGATTLRLDVMQGNSRARRLYERHGFHTTGHETVRESDGRIEMRMDRAVDMATRDRDR